MDAGKEQISWRGLNRTYTGIIVGTHPNGHLVKLDNGCYVVVNPSSTIALDKTN